MALDKSGKAQTTKNQRVAVLQSQKEFRDQVRIVSDIYVNSPEILSDDHPEVLRLRNMAEELSLTKAKKVEIATEIKRKTAAVTRQQKQQMAALTKKQARTQKGQASAKGAESLNKDKSTPPAVSTSAEAIPLPDLSSGESTE